jgi:hypothetical protein
MMEVYGVIKQNLEVIDPAALPAFYDKYRREFLRHFPSKSVKLKIPYQFVAEDTLEPDSVLHKFFGAKLADAHTRLGEAEYEATARKYWTTLHVNYWCPVGQPCVVPADTLQSTAGKVSLLVDFPDGQDETTYRWAVEENYFARKAEFIRRMLAKYGAAGLTVTVVSSSRGTTWEDGVVTPAQEADRLRWFSQDYNHLPVNVALQVRHDQWRPGLDGRRIRLDSTQEVKTWQLQQFYLLENKGLIKFQGTIGDCQFNTWHCRRISTEEVIDTELQRLLVPSSPPSTSPSTPPSTLSAAIAPPATVPRAPRRARPPTRFSPAHP